MLKTGMVGGQMKSDFKINNNNNNNNNNNGVRRGDVLETENGIPDRASAGIIQMFLLMGDFS